MSAHDDRSETEEDFHAPQHHSPVSLIVEAIAAVVALAFTLLLLKEVLPFLN